MSPPFASVSFDDLFAARGTLEMRHRDEAAALDGARVEIAGVVVALHADEGRLLLSDAPGACPDCSPVPVAAIVLRGLTVLPDGVTAGLTPVTARGTLGVGFEIDRDGYASFVRLEDARLVA